MINERVSEVQRDADTTRERLDDIKEIIEEDDIGTVEMRFGGSVMKHTYVEGLSDVDVLIIINKSELSEASPSEALEYIKTRINEANLHDVENVRVGNLAVTVTFSDGEEIQHWHVHNSHVDTSSHGTSISSGRGVLAGCP